MSEAEVASRSGRNLGPGTDPAGPAIDGAQTLRTVRQRLAAMSFDVPLADEFATTRRLFALADVYGNSPFTPLEEVRSTLGVDRPEFKQLLDLFTAVPELRTSVERGPAGKYWTNTILPLEHSGAWDAALYGKPIFPKIVGLYPGPTCMFRCHFCVRVTGARYSQEAIDLGDERLASIIEEIPDDGFTEVYLSGGLEPLTNPGLGDLVRQARRRDLRLTLYTNAFALTEQTLERQPGLWDLHAIRVSLYGVNQDEYSETTTKRGAFERVTRNLISLLTARQQRDEPVKVGLNHIILPGRAHRLDALADYIARLNEASPSRPLDFLTVREDYSGRPDGLLAPAERAELRLHLRGFEQRMSELAPATHIDYGYALEAERMGVASRLLRIAWDEMRPLAHPQVAVQVDLLGDVYLYRESGFPGLPGADRYIAGRVGPNHGLGEVVRRFVETGVGVAPRPGDEFFLDGFDQVATARLRQLERDVADGWSNERGFLR